MELFDELSVYDGVADEYPTLAIPAIAEILHLGKKQGHAPNSWRDITPTEHALAAIGHLVDYIRGRTDEQHFKHALCRTAMLTDIIERRKSPK